MKKYIIGIDLGGMSAKGALFSADGRILCENSVKTCSKNGFECTVNDLARLAFDLVKSQGGTMDDVIKTSCFLTNIGDFAAMNGIYKEFFSEGKYPARAALEVSKLPKPEAVVEIEAIAYIK